MKNQDPQKALKIVFFGTSEFAVPALEGLVNFGYNIVAVVTQPEKPVGRAKVVMPSPVKKSSISHNITVLEPHNLRKDDKVFEEFKNLNPDICIVAAYGKIIPPRYLEVPKYGFLNIHPSLLPKYRGPSPIQTAIINGDNETGVAIMKIDQEMDHGPIIATADYKLSSLKTYKEIEKELSVLGAELLINNLPSYVSGEIQPKNQQHDKATFTKLLNRDDGKIDWNKTAEEIYNQIRALNPEPGTWTIWRGKILNISTCEMLNISTSQVESFGSGMVVKINGGIAVTTPKCYLILKQIQLEGGKEMDAISFLNGHPDFPGSVLE